MKRIYEILLIGIKNSKTILVFLVTFGFYFLLTSSCESKITAKAEVDQFVQQEQKIASFLTKTTQINSKLLAVTDVKKAGELSNECLQLFTRQQQISYSFNREIDKIATTEMVNLPYLNSEQNYYEKFKLTREQKLDTIIENLIIQVALLKTLEKQTDNEEITRLTSNFLPQLSNQIELTNTFKINNYLTN